MSTRLPLRACGKSAIRRTTPQSQICLRTRASTPRMSSIRQYTTPPTADPPKTLRSQLPSSQYNPPPPPPERSPNAPPISKRSLRPYIWAALFTLFGVAGGQFTSMIVAPPELPPAGSKEDDAMVEYIHNQASKLPIVQTLSMDSAWTSHDAYTSLPQQERGKRITTGPLAGARALGGFQRIFTNTETGEVVTVIWFGGAVAGWPGVTHGGAIATVLDETFGRCAVRWLQGSTGVTANLELNYLKPVQTNGFYVIRAVPSVDAEEKMGGPRRKLWVQGRLETTDGRICVEGRALFVVPKKYSTREIKTGF
ncbi:hypothetical protein LZ554_001186 [Drepanopeziza brunnea f. sp. 'monogermtubi']|nr:hypothetical protein LZ554_001186 [Drepanopeziza brunnea f. sp. 'monogermtubi']